MRIAVAGGTGAVGRHVVDAVKDAGHEPVVLARSRGIDLVTGAGVAAALEGVQAVIDVTSTPSSNKKTASAFFETVTRTLLDAEVQAGVRHHVALGIIGSDVVPYGYYIGKMSQEHAVEAGAVPWTILRASQFHEFARQVYGQVTVGPIVLIPAMRSQPVAARTVAERLVELALASPQGHATDLAGPREERMVSMVRRLASATGLAGPIVEVRLPTGWARGMANGSLLAGPGADLAGPPFDDWLALQVRP